MCSLVTAPQIQNTSFITDGERSENLQGQKNAKQLAQGVALGIFCAYIDYGPMGNQLRDILWFEDNVTKVILTATVIGPILEELVFRFGIQDILLTRTVRRITPSRFQFFVDSKVALIARTFFTAILFALGHPDFETIRSAFFGGIFLSLLKEAQGGIGGCIAAHITSNLISTALALSSLYGKNWSK